MNLLLDVLQSGAAWLQKFGIESPRLNMELMLAQILKCRRMDLYLDFERPLTEPQLVQLRGNMKRRSKGVPLQHILGTVEFCGHDFICDNRGLIPRPETEYLVELILRRCKDNPPATVLDMGCGSGCIGLSLAHALRKSGTRVLLADISPDALALAGENRQKLGLTEVEAQLISSNLFSGLADRRFDLLVANLPYIPRGEISDLSREVRNDPVNALDGGADGLDLVKHFIAKASSHANPEVLMALELGIDQSATVSELLHAAGWKEVDIQPDLAGILRFVFARFTAHQ